MERQLGLQAVLGAHLGRRSQHSQQGAEHILQHDLPPSPVPMVASEGAEEGDIYDTCTHLSPVSTPPKEVSSASAPPGLEARA
eukprot:274531-Pyramimonas_sp.AAC.2